MSRTCIQCHEPISEARLKVLPNAAYCVKCQGMHDVPVMSEQRTNLAMLSQCRIPDDEKVIRRTRFTVSAYGLSSVVGRSRMAKNRATA